MDERRRKLLELILAVSFERRPVKLSSGKSSDFYLDLRQTLIPRSGRSSRASSCSGS